MQELLKTKKYICEVLEDIYDSENTRAYKEGDEIEVHVTPVEGKKGVWDLAIRTPYVFCAGMYFSNIESRRIKSMIKAIKEIVE